jgi:hypothetical protein
MPLAPGRTSGKAVQSWPHTPQFVGSDLTSTHFEPQRSGAGAAQLDVHAGAPAVEVQSPVGAVHFLPHCPQLSDKVVSVSQPSSPRVEQWAKPEAQAPGGTLQRPARHAMPEAPGFTLGSKPQS